ncbi:MAG: hypothetical protein HQK66_02270 [Desulfamplus sp.]|nr:hypothetical protein [Desulfamplus sp.]
MAAEVLEVEVTHHGGYDRLPEKYFSKSIILHNPSKVVDTFFEIIPEKWECGSRKCKPANEGCRFLKLFFG